MDEKLVEEIKTKHLINGSEPAERIERAMHDSYEQGYVRGAEMARRLLRLQLGLAVPEDRL